MTHSRPSRHPFALLGAGLLFAAACAHKPEAGPVIKDLEFKGNEHVKAKDLKQAILTSETSWIPFAKKKHFDPNIWATDLKRIERHYHSRGYYQAKIEEEKVEPTGEDAVRIRVKIREGPATKISKVAITGLEGLSEKHRELVLRQVTLKEGQTFDEKEWEPLKAALTAKLVEFGYAEAKAEGDAKVDLATHQAEVVVNLTPGVRYRPGDIHVVVKPGARVEEWRVREQVREAIEDEEWFSQDVQHEAQQRVFNMGVFGAAQVNPEKGDEATQRLPLRVEVQEAPFHDVGLGFGLGIEQRRNEAHLIGEFTDRDFLGGLRELTLRARVGYAFIPSAYTVFSGGDAITQSGPIMKLEAGLEQPRFFHPNFQIRGELEAERAIEPAFSYLGGRAKLGVPWRPWSWLTVEPSYNVEVYKLDKGSETSLVGGQPALLFGCEGTCLLSYLEQRVAFDRRDDPQDPHDGFYLALSLQEGGGPLGGSFDYLRVSPEARGYKSLGIEKRLVFAARARVGTLIPLAGETERDTPIVARYFSGGDGMRGFSTQRLSPMYVVRKSNASSGTEFNAEPVPIGGNGLFEGSFETRYAITRPLVLAAFVDTGFVTTEQVQWSRPGYFPDNLLWAVGAGVRYRTPVGPVRLDLAYRLPIGPRLQVYAEDSSLSYLPSEGCFGIGTGSAERGGAPEGACAIHLSIGEAF